MSVPKDKRTEGELAINTEARRICTYVLRITGNDKKFPKEQEWFTNLLREKAIGIDLNCWKGTTKAYGQKELIMVQICKTGMTPRERSELENADASAMKNKATIDYIAMMADIEIPTEEEENEHE